jgi:hypothetical protein
VSTARILTVARQKAPRTIRNIGHITGSIANGWRFTAIGARVRHFIEPTRLQHGLAIGVKDARRPRLADVPTDARNAAVSADNSGVRDASLRRRPQRIKDTGFCLFATINSPQPRDERKAYKRECQD